MIDPPQQHHLDQHADGYNDQRRRDDAAPESDRAGKSFGQRERDIGAEHVERAMREIDDARDAENDRQPRGDQKQRRRAGKSGQELNDVKGHYESALRHDGVESNRRALKSPRPACAERSNSYERSDAPSAPLRATRTLP